MHVLFSEWLYLDHFFSLSNVCVRCFCGPILGILNLHVMLLRCLNSAKILNVHHSKSFWHFLVMGWSSFLKKVKLHRKCIQLRYFLHLSLLISCILNDCDDVKMDIYVIISIQYHHQSLNYVLQCVILLSNQIPDELDYFKYHFKLWHQRLYQTCLSLSGIPRADCISPFHILKTQHNFVTHVFKDEPNLSMFGFCEMVMK